MDETNENAYEEDRSLVYLLDVIQILLNHEEVKAIYQKTYEIKIDNKLELNSKIRAIEATKFFAGLLRSFQHMITNFLS